MWHLWLELISNMIAAVATLKPRATRVSKGCVPWHGMAWQTVYVMGLQRAFAKNLGYTNLHTT